MLCHGPVCVVGRMRDLILPFSKSSIYSTKPKDVYEDEFFSIRYFQKGTAHLTFKRLELIERMNDIIAKHYPGMLAAR